MKAAWINETGSPDVIQFGEMAEPSPGAGQVLIRVEAVAVNPIDTYVRSGLVAMDLPKPFIIGCDAAGRIDAVGEGVSEFKTGDRVWCTNQGLLGRQGTFAEKIAIDSRWCFHRSDNVTSADAAASALVGVTAHLGLFREAGHLFPSHHLSSAKLSQGAESTQTEPRTILVIGGSGGVGSMVVQMAKIAGANVIATAGSAAKCEHVRSLGADQVINYREEPITDAVKRIAPQGVHLIWETRREPDFDAAVGMLRERGMMILMAGRDARPNFPVGPFYVKECTLSGFVMFKASPAEMQAAAVDIDRWLSEGKLRANIAMTLPLAEAADAHRIQESATLQGDGKLHGKIVLVTY